MGNIPPIVSFPDDDRIWRIEWLRAIEQNDLVPSEPLIQVVIAPLLPDFQNAIENKVECDSTKKYYYGTKDVGKHQTIKIGTGLLPLIKIGSLWKKGRCVLTNVAPQKTLSLNITPDNIQYIKAGNKETLPEPISGRNETFTIAPFHHNVSIKGLSTNCVAINYLDDPLGIIIPIPVLISFYYCTSSNLSRAVFNGDFQHDLDSLVNTEKCCIDEGENICSLVLRQHMHDSEGWIISRILNSPEAAKGVSMVHDSLMAQMADFDYQSLHPKSQFPFTGKTDLTVRCKPIKSQIRDEWRFLVYSIEKCTAPFPFPRLEVDRDNDNRQGDPETDLLDHQKKEAYKSKTQNNDFDTKPLANEQEPIIDGPVSNFQTPDDRFDFLKDKVIEKPKKDFCRYKSAKTKKIKNIFTNQQSTGMGTYGESSATAARTFTKTPALEASIANFTKAIAYLNEQPDIIAKVRTASQKIEYLPLTKPPRYNQWAYHNSKEKTRRAVIIADVEHLGKHHCLIDFQARENDHFPISIISTDLDWPITDQVIQLLLFELSKSQGRWLNIKKTPNSITSIQTMKHTWGTVNQFHKNLMIKIKELN